MARLAVPPLIRRGALALAVLLGAPGAARAGDYAVIHSFDGSDGAFPDSGLLVDADGTVYGTAATGGAGFGTVFRLTPPPPGQTTWTTTVLHVFQGSPDGAYPAGGVIFGADGALYGATFSGGTHRSGAYPDGRGTIYRLAPDAPGSATWTATVLHDFRGTDGVQPTGALLLRAGGALAGTTSYRDVNHTQLPGTAFKLFPPGPGQAHWRLRTLHDFTGEAAYGPATGALAPRQGGSVDREDAILFGALQGGLIYALTRPPGPAAAWSLNPIHVFPPSSNVGSLRGGGPLPGRAGVLFGTTELGGSHGKGTVYALSPPPPGATDWVLTVLHDFAGSRAGDGTYPVAVPLVGRDGVLYGTAGGGGNRLAQGAVWSLAPPAPGATAWTETVLHPFFGPPGDGSAPVGELTEGPSGALFGTTEAGGASGHGTVFMVRP